MPNDFSNYTESELQSMIASAQTVLDTKRASRTDEVKAQITELADSVGLTIKFIDPFGSKVSDVSDGRTSTLKGVKVPPKYRNPANPAETWTGRGVKPTWLSKLLAEGYELDEFRIDPPPDVPPDALPKAA